MKKQMSFKKLGLWMTAIFASAVLFSACKKDEPARVPVAAMMAFNLVPDQPGIGVAIDNNSLTNGPFGYTEYLNYQRIFPGNRLVSSFVYTTGQTMDSDQQTFRDSAYYSVFVVGTQDHYKNVFVEDKLDSLDATADKAFVRYVNAVTGDEETTATITADQNVLFNDANKTGTVSEFKEATPGQVSVTINNPGNAEPVSRDIDVEKNGVYTILLVGEPQATDTARAMKIKVVHYGNVTP